MENVDLEDASSSHREHDQLPAVASNGKSAKSDGTKAPSDDGNNLPDLEEYKASQEFKDDRKKVRKSQRPRSKISQRRCRNRIYLGVALVIVVVVSVTVGVIVGRDTAPSSSSSSGDTGNDANPRDPNETEGHDSDAYGSRQEGVIELVTRLGWSDADQVRASNTPQNKAVRWLADEDPRGVPIEDTREFRQRYALAVFRFALAGENQRWYDGDIPWMNGDDVCAWRTSVPTESGANVEMGVRCNGGTIVKELYLPNVGAEGVVPDEIELLYELEGLFLNGNDIRALTSKIGSLPNLKDLDVHENFLEGTFPEFLGVMTLRTLDLSYNKLYGKFPEILSGFSSLETFDVGYNSLSDDINRLSVLNNVKYLDISNNTLTGTFGNELLSSWSQLEVLDASDNEIRGSLPSNLFEHDRLNIVDLHGNFFTGNLPQAVRYDAEMSFLALHSNQLSGPIDVITNNLIKLKHLDLSSNSFTGTIPSFEKMSNLQYLFLADNLAFQGGPIPESIAQLPGLVDVSLQLTLRSGGIPAGFGSQPNLALLDLSYNHLDGTIPSSLGAASALMFLFLNRNDLTGAIPETFRNLKELRSLLLDRNKLVAPASPVCDAKSDLLRDFIADCDEINCPVGCCTRCCEDSDAVSTSTCDDRVDSNLQLDPVGKAKYQRNSYLFDSDTIVYPGGGNR